MIDSMEIRATCQDGRVVRFIAHQKIGYLSDPLITAADKKSGYRHPFPNMLAMMPFLKLDAIIRVRIAPDGQ